MLRILATPDWAMWVLSRPDLPPEVLEAAATSPEPGVRGMLALSHSAPGGVRARLVDDPDRRVRRDLAEGPMCLSPSDPLPLAAYEQLARDPDPIVREALLETPLTPPEAIALLRRDPDLRRGALNRSEELPPDEADRLIEDPDPIIRHRAMLLSLHRRPELVARLLDSDTPPPELVTEAPLTREQAERYARGPVGLRSAVAANQHLPADLVLELGADESSAVRLVASMRPELTEQQRMAIDVVIEAETRVLEASWAWSTEDPELIGRCIGSAHLGLRRSVTANPNLTPDQVTRLAADADFAVRLLLCERRDDVPGDVLLATYLQAQNINSQQLLGKPTFPRHGLAALADHASPRARALVVLDPDAPAELIERLSRDPSAQVRGSAAADRRLPVGRVLELLEDPEACAGAAANRRLPRAVMERLLTDAGL